MNRRNRGFTTTGCRRGALCFLLAVAMLGGCTGGMHRRGDQRVAVMGSYGKPIKGRSLGFDGKGTADGGGISVAYQHFVLDRLALMGIVGYRYYDQFDGAAHAVELEFGTRHMIWEIGPVAFSFDGSAGGSLATSEVPPGGTPGNFIFGFGPTIEIKVSDDVHALIGYQWRHLSNGRGGQATDNPTQNTHRFWAGVSLKW